MSVRNVGYDPGTALDTYAHPEWCVGEAPDADTVSDAFLFIFGTYVDGRLLDPRGPRGEDWGWTQ